MTGRVATIYEFVSKSTNKCLHFFKVLRSGVQKEKVRKLKKFEWTLKCQRALDELKYYLNSSPLLTKAEDSEILYLYLEILSETISFVLVWEVGKQQKPIYYINKVLQGAKQRYSITKNAALAIVSSA